MKKNLVVSLFMFMVALVSVFPIQIGMGNDRWTLGLAENTDDQLTGSVHLRQGFKALSATLDYLTITNRGTKEPDGVYKKGRTDILNVALGYTPNFYSVGDSSFSIGYEVFGGISFYGNLGSEWVQNMIHKVMGNPPIGLPVSNNIMLFPLANLKMHVLCSISDSILFRSTTSYLLDAYGTGFSTLLDAEVSYRGFFASLGLDYTWMWGSEWISEMYGKCINGIGIDFSMMAGKAISFSYRMNPINHRSYAILAVDTDGFKHEWTESLVRFGCSRQILNGVAESNGLSLEHRVTDSMDAGIELKYTSGFQNNSKANNNEFRTSRNYGHWLAGVSFHKDFGFVDPYIGIRCGVSHFYVDKLLCINPDNGADTLCLADDWYPTASIELGVRFLPDGLLVIGPSSVRMNVFFGADWFPDDLEKTIVKDNLHEGYQKPAVFMHYGIGAVFGF